MLVQSILYGTDNSVTLEAARRLGDAARAVALVSADVTEEHLDRLRGAGVMGVRCNRMLDGVLPWADALALGPRLAARGMHLEVLLGAERHGPDLAEEIRDLACPLVIGHCALPDMAAGEGAPSLAAIRRLLGDGHAWIKLSGLYRFAPAPWDAADPIVAAFAREAPERCLWGSDWPHVMLGGVPMPDAGRLLDAFTRQVERAEDRQRILVDNPAALYGF